MATYCKCGRETHEDDGRLCAVCQANQKKNSHLQFIIEESRVFRDRDFGLGMFEDDGDVRCEVVGDRVWLMCGSNQVRFGEKIDDDGLAAEDAESIGHVLIAAGRAARQHKEQIAALMALEAEGDA